MPAPKVHFGPYKTPRFKIGATVTCKIRGDVEIVRMSDGRIPWPLGKRKGERGVTFVIYRGLAKALRKESNIAVQYHWGVAPCTVSKWRRELNIDRNTEGTRAAFVAHGKSPAIKRALKKAHAKARDPVRREKIAASKRGKKRPRHVIEAMCDGRLGKPHSAETRRKMSEAHRKRGTYPPAAGKRCTEKEDTIMTQYPTDQAARRT